MRKAEDAARRGKMAEAAACYRQLVAATPDDLGLLQRLADAQSRSGSSEEARNTFVKLADAYHRQGHRTRALAAIKRALREGEPDADTLLRAAEFSIAGGLRGEAREPFLRAGSLRETEGDYSGARAIYERAAVIFPRDDEIHEARARVVQLTGDEEEMTGIRLERAVAAAGGGDVARAVSSLAEAVKSSPDSSSSFQTARNLAPRLAPRFSEVPSELVGVGAPTAFAWSVVRLILVESRGRLAEVEPDIKRIVGWAAAGGKLSPEARREAAAALTALGATAEAEVVAPSQAATKRADPVPAKAPVAPKSPAPIDPTVSPEELRDLPEGVRARLFEAEALVKHRLLETASRALRGIPPEWRGHPAVRRVADALTSAGGPSEAPAPPPAPEHATNATASQGSDALAMPEASAPSEAPPPSGSQSQPSPDEPAESQPPPSEPAQPSRPVPQSPPAAEPPAPAEPEDPNDDLVLVLEDDDGSTDPAKTFDPATQPSGGPDLAALSAQIGTMAGEADGETSYQMGMGLLEMGLPEQAIPLLEQASREQRRVHDATLLLVRAHRERHDEPAALRALEGGLERAAGRPPELVLALADAVLRLGQVDRATELVRELVSRGETVAGLENLKHRLRAAVAKS
jgi:tetratricopeptide (TPR) repeat protein